MLHVCTILFFLPQPPFFLFIWIRLFLSVCSFRLCNVKCTSMSLPLVAFRFYSFRMNKHRHLPMTKNFSVMEAFWHQNLNSNGYTSFASGSTDRTYQLWIVFNNILFVHPGISFSLLSHLGMKLLHLFLLILHTLFLIRVFTFWAYRKY